MGNHDGKRYFLAELHMGNMRRHRMFIRKVKIHNFKCYRDFEITLEEGLNIVVGDNEAGKSTILEAINLALTGIISGKSIWNEISQYIFNKEAVDEYIVSLGTAPIALPCRKRRLYKSDSFFSKIYFRTFSRLSYIYACNWNGRG